MDVFLNALAYDLIPAIDYIAKPIRDGKDQPILNAAIFYEIDMILTGDKDFLCLNLDYPKCVNVSEFMNREGIVFQNKGDLWKHITMQYELLNWLSA